MKDFEETLHEIEHETDALQSSMALNKILHALLVENRREKFALWVIIIGLICVIISGIIGFFIHESQFEEETTETTWTYSEVSGESSAINNVTGDQYNDQATNYHYTPEEA